MAIEAIDHWVLVVKDLEATFAFYRRLGLEAGWQERPGGRGTRPIIPSARRRSSTFTLSIDMRSRVRPLRLATQWGQRTFACAGKGQCRRRRTSSSRLESRCSKSLPPAQALWVREPAYTCVTPMIT